jgi:hypothetical protein
MTDSLPLAEIKSIILSQIPDPNAKIFLFGSRATGTAQKWSDIDIGILPSSKMPWNTLPHIKEDLESSTIPYKVDVVDFSVVSDRFKSVALQKTIPL